MRIQPIAAPCACFTPMQCSCKVEDEDTEAMCTQNQLPLSVLEIMTCSVATRSKLWLALAAQRTWRAMDPTSRQGSHITVYGCKSFDFGFDMAGGREEQMDGCRKLQNSLIVL